MNNLISSTDEITIKWISSILEQKHVLPSALIQSVSVLKRWKTTSSEIAVVKVEYADCSSKFPASLFVKITSPQLSAILKEQIGCKEVTFYNSISLGLPQDDLIHCYFAGYDERDGIFNLVLEDLTSSHVSTEWPLSPSIGDCELAVGCLVNLHSYWWDHKNLGGLCDQAHSQIQHINNLKSLYNSHFVGFEKYMGDRMPDVYKTGISMWANRIESLSQRVFGHNNITLTHGDSHFWNFMFPKQAGGNAKLFDWQSYRVGLGTNDLAYMIAMHWYPSRRKCYEIPLLKNYHLRLCENGVANYSFDELLSDYRWSIIHALCIPMWQWSMKLSPSIWLGHLERISAAFDDMSCAELLSDKKYY